MSGGALLVALQEHHEAIALLCDRLQDAETSGEKAALLGSFSKALVAHLEGLTMVLLPAVVEQDQTLSDAADELMDGARRLRALLAEALSAPMDDDDTFTQATESVCIRVRAQIAAEFRFLGATLTKFSNTEQLLLASELELEAERFSTELSGLDKSKDS